MSDYSSIINRGEQMTTNHTQQQEDNDAWFARADRFDGFDRGDLDWDYEAEQQARNEAEDE
jgi:hypothetical protein